MQKYDVYYKDDGRWALRFSAQDLASARHQATFRDTSIIVTHGTLLFVDGELV